MAYSVRPMRVEDIPQVAQTERESFPTSWPPTSFKRELGNRLSRYLVALETPRDTPPSNAQCGVVAPEASRSFLGSLLREFQSIFSSSPQFTAASQDFIVGFVGVWFMTDEAHITSIAVREAYRRLGIGELLLQTAVEMAIARRCRLLTLEARVSNTGAHALYQKYGFKKVGIRKGYYADNHEDAVIMSTDSITSPEYQGRFSELLDAYGQRRGRAVRILA